MGVDVATGGGTKRRSTISATEERSEPASWHGEGEEMELVMMVDFCFSLTTGFPFALSSTPRGQTSSFPEWVKSNYEAILFPADQLSKTCLALFICG